MTTPSPGSVSSLRSGYGMGPARTGPIASLGGSPSPGGLPVGAPSGSVRGWGQGRRSNGGSMTPMDSSIQMQPMVDPYKARARSRNLTEWVTFNEQMCKLIGRVGAPKAIEIATVWLDTMGRFYDEHGDDYQPEKPDPTQATRQISPTA